MLRCAQHDNGQGSPHLPTEEVLSPNVCELVEEARQTTALSSLYHRFHGGESDGQVLEAEQDTSLE